MKILQFVSNHVKRSLEIIFRNILTVNMERTQSGHSVPYPRTKRLFGLLTVPFHIAGVQDVNSTLKVSHFFFFFFFTWSEVLQVQFMCCSSPETNHRLMRDEHSRQTQEVRDRMRKKSRQNDKVVPGVVFAASSSSSGYGRKRRSSSFLSTTTWK